MRIQIRFFASILAGLLVALACGGEAFVIGPSEANGQPAPVEDLADLDRVVDVGNDGDTLRCQELDPALEDPRPISAGGGPAELSAVSLSPG